jgi:transposase-like protein
MKKTTKGEGKRCPKCGATENQAKKGYNRSGTQRCKCKECGAWYTTNPKKREYPDETRQAAIKTFYSGVSGCGVGKIFGMSKANVYNWIKKNAEK